MQNLYTNQIFQRQPLSINFIISVERAPKSASENGEEKKSATLQTKNILLFIVYHTPLDVSIFLLFIYYVVHCCHDSIPFRSRGCLCSFVCAIRTHKQHLPKIGKRKSSIQLLLTVFAVAVRRIELCKRMSVVVLRA